MKWLRVVIRVPTSTHSMGLIRVISTDEIQSNPRVAVDLIGGKTFKNHHPFLQMLLYHRVKCRKNFYLWFEGVTLFLLVHSETINVERLLLLLRGTFEQNIFAQLKDGSDLTIR